MSSGTWVGCMSTLCAPERGIWRSLSRPQNNVYSLPHPPREGIYFFNLLLAARCSLEGSGDVPVFAMKLNKSNDTWPMCTHKFQEGKFQCGMPIEVADILGDSNTESRAKREKYNFPALSCPFLNCLPGCIHQLASLGPSFHSHAFL